jgi:hypothetical protein
MIIPRNKQVPRIVSMIAFIVILGLLAAVWLVGCNAEAADSTVKMPTSVIWISTGTPLPIEYYQQDQYTNGVIIGGIVLTAIVLIGTLAGVKRRD